MNEQLAEIKTNLESTLSSLSEFVREYDVANEVKNQTRALGEKQKKFEELLEEKNSFEKSKAEFSKIQTVVIKQKEENRLRKLQMDKREKALADKQDQVRRILEE